MASCTAGGVTGAYSAGAGALLLASLSTGAMCTAEGAGGLPAKALLVGLGLLTAKVASKAAGSRRLARLVGALGSGMVEVCQRRLKSKKPHRQRCGFGGDQVSTALRHESIMHKAL